MKLWDLSKQHCIQTVVAHRSEIWTLDINPEEKLIFTGSAEGEMKAWNIDHEALAGGLQESETGEVCCYLHAVATTTDGVIRSPKSYTLSLRSHFPPNTVSLKLHSIRHDLILLYNPTTAQ